MKNLTYILLILCCTSCSEDDIIPSSLMNFEELAVLEAWNVHNAAGFLGSEKRNSLFIASREANPETEMDGERLLRYDLSDGEITADFTDITDFVTKEIHIQQDEIIVLAGQHVNTYDIDFNKESVVVEHGLSLSRFGSALYKDDIYIWGGDLNDVDSDKIKRWNKNSNTFQTVATLPARKAGAHGEIIGDKLYIFGGQEHWLLEPPNDVIFIYDFEDGSVETTNLPEPVFRTFTDVYKGKIFIAGQLIDADPFTQDFDIFLAVFDPDDNSIHQIETTLSDERLRTIHQMAIVNNDLYVLYGDVGLEPGVIKLMRHKL